MRALVALLLVSCGGAAARPPEPPPAPEAVSGYWELADGSGVFMQIALVEGTPHIEAWSKSSGSDADTRFEVSDIAWDGRRLQATFTYPSNKTVTRSDLMLVNADRLEGTVTGPYQAREVWIRKLPPKPTASGSGDTPQRQP